ncbi:MAG TPA: bifunctional riboflavin kinase/FAD synthetase, partial [Armatimonadetes bacterium]|nr:bifunctional riboflavin kinase/FAD synthetase [Armatimonadota bacterium]
KILYSQLHARSLVIGETSAIGCNRGGTPQRLRELRNGAQLEMRIVVVSTVHVMNDIVSSSRIRTALRNGDIDLARELLGRPYSLTGSVAHGRKLAQRLGFPTINIQVPDEKLLPRYGVYAGYARIGNIRCPMVANIGVRPTVDGRNVSVEAHLLDYKCQQTPKRASLELLFFLRPERRFESIEVLAQQVKRDIANARKMLRV